MSAPESEPTPPPPSAAPAASQSEAERGARPARGGSRRDQARHRRPGRDARARARLPRRRWPPADRGRPGPREDADHQDDGRRARRLVPPRPVHADLVPSDLVGTRIYRPDQGGFDTELGPVFCNFLLADEINRAPAKVQSALLEVMQEHQVTIGARHAPRPEPFLVMATQNPIESEGTYPLPEAQVDRFMLKVLVGYPERDEELTVVHRSLDDPVVVEPGAPARRAARAAGRGVKDVYVDPGLSATRSASPTATRSPPRSGSATSASSSRTARARAGRSRSSRAPARSR